MKVRGIGRNLLALVAVLGLTTVAQAANVDKFSLNYPNTGGTASGIGTSTLTYSSVSGVSAPSGSGTLPNFTGSTVSGTFALTVGTNVGSAIGAPVTVAAGSPFTINYGGQTATFTFVPSAAVVINAASTVGVSGGQDGVTNGFWYLSSASNSDFGQLDRIFTFSFTTQNLLTSGPSNSWNWSQANSGSGTFTGTNNIFIPNIGSSVPEPATLATFGLMTVCGGYLTRRKLKAAKVAQA